MILEALGHFPGLGPARLAKLREAGVRTWRDLVEQVHRLPVHWRDEILAECGRCLEAEQAGDVRYFVERLEPVDKWRILDRFGQQATYFDIETEGLDYDARITVIACWHRGTLRTFVEQENLDEFLELLDDVQLLVSFNGSSFDVPRVLDAFHIPHLPCPHLDLRWICHHRGWKGGLKDIASVAGITRPVDLALADGALAIRLWSLWIARQDQVARQQLLRYCAADVLLLPMLADRLLGREPADVSDLWAHLPSSSLPGGSAFAVPPAHRNSFGAPSRLRAVRHRSSGWHF